MSAGDPKSPLPAWDSTADWNAYQDQNNTTISSGSVSIIAGETEISNYLEDDWDDNSLTTRSSTNDGVFAHPDANEAGDVLVGRYRPQWTTTDGSPSASGGALVVGGGSSPDEVAIVTDFSVGSWESDFTHQSTNNGKNSHFVISSSAYSAITGASNRILHQAGSDGSGANYDLFMDGSDIITSTWDEDTNQHTRKITRDSYGNWELFLDGTSKGTATDTFFPGVTFGMQAPDSVECHWDNLVVK